MLQQTTVKTATPYFEAFAERFPTVAALAEAREEDVLASWSGLGYYHRGRNLWRAARHLTQHHSGRFPKTLEAALAVPGVGLYTASAVLSIAFSLPLPVVDGNVRRVLARVFALRGPKWARDGPYYNLADEIVDRTDPGDWNQALMELGATVCTPRRPACPVCPVRRHCRAFARGLTDVLPEARARRATVDVTVAAALIEKGGRLLLVRRAEGRLMGRMWEVPQTGLGSSGLPDLVREIEERHALVIEPGALMVRARHAITHHRIKVEGYGARLHRPPPRDRERYLWADPGEVAGLAVSGVTRKLVTGFRAAQMPLPLD